MIESNFVFSRLLAELLRLQKWTAGESVSAARIYGLMHGFEESLHEESSTFGVSRELQRKVEDVLDDVGKGVQARMDRA